MPVTEPPLNFLLQTNLQSLPEYKHVQGVRLAGSAFADALMVVEFLNTFGSALDLGKLSDDL